VNATEDANRLARRLRSLRRETWPGKRITQGDLADALEASPPLISSWEGGKAVPPPERLDSYARFFATEKSVVKRPFRLISDAQLTNEEAHRRDDLFRELTGLRAGIQGDQPGDAAATDPFAGSMWRFPSDQDITIVASALPDHYLSRMPYSDPKAPDYVDLYRYADLDALLELHGHIRAVNPMNKVVIRTADRVRSEDYTSHLVLLGGVDWNTITAELLHRLDLPVRQLVRDDEGETGAFVVDQGGRELHFPPKVRKVRGEKDLVEDVAHFYRTASPLNEKRTITICNGNYQRGTFAAVRALTDPRFRDRNEQHVRTRFGETSAFSILCRAKVFLGTTVTPDWTSEDDVLHEWPVA
jgi:transcriptional regulator with XRE-family HTH domain